jgi:hypothetical protein
MLEYIKIGHSSDVAAIRKKARYMAETAGHTGIGEILFIWLKNPPPISAIT